MNRKNKNIFRWSALGLSVLLMTTALLLATGTAWARYRAEIDMLLNFKAKKPVTVSVGQIDSETSEFTIPGELAWEMTEGQQKLRFAVANCEKADEFPKEDQRFQVRLVGGLGIWTGEAPAAITLTIHADTADGEPTVVEAQPVRIQEETLMYNTFGDGWIFCFLDEDGEELSWTLEGREFSCRQMDLTIVLEDGQQISPTRLQLQVTGRTEE